MRPRAPFQDPPPPRWSARFATVLSLARRGARYAVADARAVLSPFPDLAGRSDLAALEEAHARLRIPVAARGARRLARLAGDLSAIEAALSTGRAAEALSRIQELRRRVDATAREVARPTAIVGGQRPSARRPEGGGDAA